METDSVKSKKKVRKTEEASRTKNGREKSKLGTKNTDNGSKINLINMARVIFPNSWKKAQKWLKEHEIEVTESVYYKTLSKSQNSAFEFLSKEVAQNYLPLVKEIIISTQFYKQQILQELQNPNITPSVKIMGYSKLLDQEITRFDIFDEVRKSMERNDNS